MLYFVLYKEMHDFSFFFLIQALGKGWRALKVCPRCLEAAAQSMLEGAQA